MRRMIEVLTIASALSLGVIASTSTYPQQTGWRDRHIDGSSEAAFEISVATLQKELPSHRREDFEIALAAIWMSKSLGPGGLDLDGDGDVDVIDSRLLADDTLALLTDIERGDLLPSIEKRGRKAGKYTAADYVRQLDGLGYDQVLDLAGRPSDVSLPGMARFPSRPAEEVLDARTGKALNQAIEALNLGDYARARSAIGTLKTSRFSPYGRSKVEQILFAISYGEGQFAEAREHLQNAVSAGGLNAQEVSAVLVQLRVVDSKLAGNPPGLLALPKFP